MIATIIVGTSVGLAGVFFVAWLVKRDFRRSIELPKYDFQEQLRQYDLRCSAQLQENGADSDAGKK